MFRTSGTQWLFYGSVALLAAAFWAVPGSLKASILLPDQSLREGEQLLAESEVEPVRLLAGSSAGAGFTNHQPANGALHQLFWSLERPDETIFAQLQLAPGGASTGASTSTSGPGGSSAHPIDSVADVSLFDAELVAWIAGERRCSLPMPPENELLRPPQEC